MGGAGVGELYLNDVQVTTVVAQRTITSSAMLHDVRSGPWGPGLCDRKYGHGQSSVVCRHL